MTTKDTLALALEALETCTYTSSYYKAFDIDKVEEAITAIKQAITPETGNAAPPPASAITAGNGQAQEPGERIQATTEYWQEVYPEGLTPEEVNNELSDYYGILNGLDKLYDHITGGQCSKPNTDKAVVMALADDYMSEIVERALKDEGAAPKQAEPIDAARAKEQT